MSRASSRWGKGCPLRPWFLSRHPECLGLLGHHFAAVRSRILSAETNPRTHETSTENQLQVANKIPNPPLPHKTCLFLQAGCEGKAGKVSVLFFYIFLLYCHVSQEKTFLLSNILVVQ